VLPSWLVRAAETIRTWAGWRWIGYSLSALIIAVSVIVLWHVLRNLQIEGVVDALRATPPHKIVAAALFVAAAFVTLTFYEYFGLRTIGIAHVPYRLAVLASFTGYSIGHNVGAPALTGGAVRYRIYSPWGLRVIDIAKLCFITGLTFWLGNTTVLGLGMIIEPQAVTAVDQLPAAANRIIGIVDGQSPQWATDLSANRDRDPRSRLHCLRHVSLDAGTACDRFHDAGGNICVRHPARFCESCARLDGCLRRGDAGRTHAIRQGATGRGAGVVSPALFCDSVLVRADRVRIARTLRQHRQWT
jgi:hypothetical protein